MLQAVSPNRGGVPAHMHSTRDTLANLDGFEDANVAMDMDRQLHQMQQPQMFPVLMPQNIQGQVMAPLMQVPMPYNTSEQTCFAWMAPMQGVQGVQNVQMQFTPQISGQSQFSQDSLDQGDRLSFVQDQGQPQPHPQLQQLLLMTPPQAQQAQQPLQQMQADAAAEVVQMQRQRQQQQMLQQGQNPPRQQQNGRPQQQQQQQPLQMMRQQQMMQGQMQQSPPQQPPQNLDGQPPGTWHRDPEQWMRPQRRNNWEEAQQDWQQLGSPMQGQNNPVSFGIDVPQAWAYGGNEAGYPPPPYSATSDEQKTVDRIPATKMNWAELSENTGDHLMPGPMDFRANSQRGPKSGGIRNQALQQPSMMHRSGGADRRGMERGMLDGNKKPSGRSGAGRQNLGPMDGMMYSGTEVMAGTGEAPMFGQSRDLWDGAGPMLNRGRGGPGDSGIPGGRNSGDRRRGPWGDAPGNDAGRNGNMPGGPMANGNGAGRPAPWNPAAADTMKAQLQALQLEDPATVFIARRINKLGFTSAEQLEAHFSKYGEVKGVYVSHSRVKSLRAPGDRNMHDAHWRLRAAALGFVVMKAPEATAKILAEGSEHNVNGVTVRLQSFHRRNCADAAPGDDKSVQLEEAPPQEFPRWPSPGSDDDRTPTRAQLPSPIPSPNKVPTNMIPKVMEEPDMSDAAQLYYNYVISGGPIIYTSGQEELTNAMPECYSD